MTEETWLHICPIHGEETCLAERLPTEQVHSAAQDQRDTSGEEPLEESRRKFPK